MTTSERTWPAAHVWSNDAGYEQRCERREGQTTVVYDERCHRCSHEAANAAQEAAGGLTFDESWLALHPLPNCACAECETERERALVEG